VAFTNEQVERAIQRLLERPDYPIEGVSGRRDATEQFNRVMSYVFTHFLLHPRLTYRLAVLARNRLLKQLRILNTEVEDSILELVRMDVGTVTGRGQKSPADIDLGVGSLLGRPPTISSNDFNIQSQRFQSQTETAVEQLVVMSEWKASVGELAQRLPTIITGLATIFDDLNYVLRHDEQIDYIRIKDRVARYVMDNLTNLLTGDTKTLTRADVTRSEVEDVLLDMLSARSFFELLERRQDPDAPYVRSPTVIGGSGHGSTAIPMNTTYTLRLVGEVDNPKFATGASGPFFFYAVEDLRLYVTDSNTGAILRDETQPVPEFVNSDALGQKIVSRNPVNPVSTMPGPQTLIVQVGNDIIPIVIPGAIDVATAIGLVDAAISAVFPMAGCQWYMGRPETQRPCLFTGGGSISLLASYDEVTGIPTAPIHTLYEDTASPFFGWVTGQQSYAAYTAHDVVTYLNVVFSDSWIAAVATAEELQENYLGPVGDQYRYGTYGVFPDLEEVVVEVVEVMGNRVFRFPTMLNRSYIGYKLDIPGGPNRGSYQLLYPNNPLAVEDNDWVVTLYGLSEIAIFEPLSSSTAMASLTSEHLTLQFVETVAPTCETLVTGFCEAGMFAGVLTLLPTLWSASYRDHIEFVGSRLDAAGIWRFDFGKAGVERGDVLGYALRSSFDFINAEQLNLVDSLVESDKSWGTPADSVGTNRRLKTSVALPASVRVENPVTHVVEEVLFNEVQAEVSSYYFYWHQQMNQHMRAFRSDWLPNTKWLEWLAGGKLEAILSGLQTKINSRSDRLSLLTDLAGLYATLLDTDSQPQRADVVTALRSLGISVPSTVGKTTLEGVLRSYDPPDRESDMVGVVDTVLSALNDVGYDRARDLLVSLRLPEFFLLTGDSASYGAAFALTVRQVLYDLPTNLAVGVDTGNLQLGRDSDLIMGEELADG